jgi:uncharacterized protein YbbC (DUF1343 family)
MFRYRSQAIIVVCAAAALFGAPVHSRPPAAENRTLTGIDAYESMGSDPFAGKRVGLITNQTGVDSQGVRTIDLIARRRDSKLVAIFSPEHGISGKVDATVADATDPATGIPIHSLYGETRRPTDEM